MRTALRPAVLSRAGQTRVLGVLQQPPVPEGLLYQCVQGRLLQHPPIVSVATPIIVSTIIPTKSSPPLFSSLVALPLPMSPLPPPPVPAPISPPKFSPLPYPLHQQKYYLRLMRRRCVLVSATSFLRPVRPERPELRCSLLCILCYLATLRCIRTPLHPHSTSR